MKRGLDILILGLAVCLGYYIFIQNRNHKMAIPAQATPFFQVDTNQLFYEERNAHLKNKVPTIFFSHGLLFSNQMWKDQMDFFEKKGYHIIAYDHRGQGKSSIPKTDIITLDENYFDAVGIIEQLNLTNKKVIFVGLSMGGFIGLRIASRRPDLIEKLILLDTSSVKDSQPTLKRFQNNLFSTWLQYFGSNELIISQVLPQIYYLEGVEKQKIEKWRGMLRELKPSIYKSVQGVFNRPGIESEVSLIKAPTLIIHGEEDKSLPISEGLLIFKNIKDSVFVSIPKCGHQSNSEYPDLINQQINEFILLSDQQGKELPSSTEVSGTLLSSLDHLLYITPSLSESMDYFEKILGIRPVLGGKHEKWGTQNAILSLGNNIYLEIISKDEENKIEGKRPLGLQDLPKEAKLATWCARSFDLQSRVDKSKEIDLDLGNITQGSRKTSTGELLSWSNTDFLKQEKDFNPFPFFVNWSKTPSQLHPSITSPQGLTLKRFEIIDPDPEELQKKFLKMGLLVNVVEGDTTKFRALIDSPKGLVEI